MQLDELRCNLLEVLAEVDEYLSIAVAEGREALVSPSAAYACASMAVIRLQGLFETEKDADDNPLPNKYEPFFSEVTSLERRGLSRTRNIAAHRGYKSMDDTTLWLTLSEDMPPLIEKLRRAASLV